MLSFHPVPRTRIEACGAPVRIEVPIANGTTCRSLAVPPSIAPHVSIHLREGDAGIPGELFYAHSLSSEDRGGFIGEHVGPKTLVFWVSSVFAGITFGGALALESTPNANDLRCTSRGELVSGGEHFCVRMIEVLGHAISFIPSYSFCPYCGAALQ